MYVHQTLQTRQQQKISWQTKFKMIAIALSTLPVMLAVGIAIFLLHGFSMPADAEVDAAILVWHNRLLLNLLSVTGIATLVSGIIVFVVAHWFSRSIQEEQQRLQKQMDVFAQAMSDVTTGKLDTRIPVVGKNGTFYNLASKFNQMAIALEKGILELKHQQTALNLSAIVSISDRKGDIIYANSKFSEISGYSQEELIGQNHRIVNSGYHPKEFFSQMWKTISSGQVWHGEIQNRRKDGSFYWVHSTLLPLLDTQDRITGYISIRFDITEHKQAEEKLQALAAEQERLVQEIKNRQDVLDEAAIVSEADRKGNITYVNDKFCAISGYSLEELIGKNHRLVNSGYHCQEFFEEFWKTISSGRVWRGELKNKRKDGSFYWVDSTVAPIFDANAKIAKYIGIRFDITEQKEIAERLEKLADERKQEADDLTQQVVRLLGEIQGAANGDLTVTAPVSDGILEPLADSFNYLISSLQKVVLGIQSAAEQAKRATTTSIADTNELTHQARTQALQIENSLRQIERILHSIKDVSEAAKRTEQVAKHAAKTAEEGEKAVDRTVDGINQLRQTISETGEMMKRLGKGSQQIGKIVTSISQIASQTNLLALNATIEAAKAGEQGQGFAVVAQEVRKLAASAAVSTEEISQIVKTIQNDISRVIGAMEEGTQQVINGTELAAEAKTNLKAIIEVSREINSLIHNIAQAAQKQAASAEEVSVIVKQSSEISINTAQKAETVTISLNGLAKMVNQLQNSVVNFQA
ncbi:MAG: PAS domain S-box protein [Scytonema sp. PMC 1069.18]|nr:PAS domain S-box protein [Scytonema sp. PMC 1069.18]MEC4886298.1 PAS domain S-box protein [Scytonema sp. PMC 1070.18]